MRARQAKLAGGGSISPSRTLNGVKRLNTNDSKGGVNKTAFKDEFLDLDDPLGKNKDITKR